jgi:polysaccharide pyruvyl transferase WcaK-like protein
MGDDSFGLEPAEATEVQAALTRVGLGSCRFLAVNLRIGTYAPSHAQYLHHFARLVARLARYYALPLLVVPISCNDDDSDIRSGYQLREAVQSECLCVLDDPDLSPRQVKGILGRAHAAVGSSYHFCTFALSQGVPAICTFDGAYYAQKARGLARFWGEDRLWLPLRQCHSESALSQTTSFIDDARLRDALQVRASRAVNTWKETFDRAVHDALFGRPARGVVTGAGALAYRS